MAKKNDGGGIQQAAGLIRYFDEESEHAWRITKLQVYAACIILAGFFYMVNMGVVQAIWRAIAMTRSGSVAARLVASPRSVARS